MVGMRPAALPGAEVVENGLAELHEGRETVGSLLVSIAATRLGSAGCTIHDPLGEPEHRLYALLCRDGSDSAHARYNALLRRLSSYARAVECVAP